MYVPYHACAVKPEIIHTPGKFWLKLTFSQQVSFFFLVGYDTGVSQKIIRQCTRGIIVEKKKISAFIYFYLHKKLHVKIIHTLLNKQ